MSDRSSLESFRLHHLLYLGAGFIHLNTVLSGIFFPLWGLTFIFVAVATYFVLCFLATITENLDASYPDFVDVFEAKSFPGAKTNLLVCCAMTLICILLVILYNQDLLPYPWNSTLMTLVASLLGGLFFVVATKRSSLLVMTITFVGISLPLTFFPSLIFGAVVTLPLLFIFLFRRSLD